MKKLSIYLMLIGASTLLLSACGEADEQYASVSGRVYFDQDADKECDECECGIPEVHIKLFESSCGGELINIIHTNQDGNFVFLGLQAGQYCVFSDLDPQCNGYMATTSVSHQFELQAGEALTLKGFGYDFFVDQVQK